MQSAVATIPSTTATLHPSMTVVATTPTTVATGISAPVVVSDSGGQTAADGGGSGGGTTVIAAVGGGAGLLLVIGAILLMRRKPKALGSAKKSSGFEAHFRPPSPSVQMHTAEDLATKPVDLPAPLAETNPQLRDGIAGKGALPPQTPVDKPVESPSDREYTQVASRVQEEGLPVLLSRLSRSVSSFFITEEDLKLPTETAAKSDVTERGQPASSSNSVALAGGRPTGTQGMLVTDLEA